MPKTVCAARRMPDKIREFQAIGPATENAWQP